MHKSKYFLSLACCAFVACNNDDDEKVEENKTNDESLLLENTYQGETVAEQRQKAIDNFIADFYCHKAKLIIELDGSQHYSEIGLHNDTIRTEKLEGYNLKVIRIPNTEIDKNFRGVCEYIDKIVKTELAD